MPRGIPWTPTEDQLLIELAGRLPLEVIARRLYEVREVRYTVKAVEHRIYHFNRLYGLKMTTGVWYQKWTCVNCGEVTYFPLDTEGWCEECLLKAAIERTRKCIEDEERLRKQLGELSKLSELGGETSKDRHTLLQVRQTEENNRRLRQLRQEYGAKRTQLHRLRTCNGTNPQIGSKEPQKPKS